MADKLIFIIDECGEFPSLGERYETTQAEEAVRLYNNISPERLHLGPSVGIRVFADGDETEVCLVMGRSIDLDYLHYCGSLRNDPDVRSAVASLIKLFPEKVVVFMKDDSETYRLAVALDEFFYIRDAYEYADVVEDREENIHSLAEDICNQSVDYLIKYLDEVVEECEVEDDVIEARRLKQLLKARREASV